MSTKTKPTSVRFDFSRQEFMQLMVPSTRLTLEFLSLYAQVPVMSLVMSLSSVISVLAKKKLTVSKISSFRIQVNNWCLVPHVGSTKGSSLITKIIEAVEKFRKQQEVSRVNEVKKNKKNHCEVRLRNKFSTYVLG
jgi:hypothetical protein